MVSVDWLLIVFGFLAVSFGLPIFLLRHITRFQRRNPKARISSRFMMIDLFSLMFLCQLPYALMRLVDARISDMPAIAFGWMLTVSLLIWGAALSATNRIGATSRLARVVATSFTFPGAVASGFSVWIVAALLVQKWRSLNSESEFSLPSNFPIVATLLILGVIAVELSSRWIVSSTVLNQLSSDEFQ